MARQSSNPVFTRSAPLHESLNGTGYAAPTAGQVAEIYGTPQRLTMDDVVVKTGLLLGIVVATGAFAWFAGLGGGVIIVAALVGFALALVNIFKREVSPPLVLAYGAFMGTALGGISRFMNEIFPGIVVQATVGTVAVFGAVLWGYKTGRLQATPRFRKIVTMAFLGLFAVLVLNIVVGLFGDGDALGIRGDNFLFSVLFSLAFITVGALTFVLDFDQADRMIEMGVDSKESWRIAFGLVVGLVWLYLEVLRLLSYFYSSD